MPQLSGKIVVTRGQRVLPLPYLLLVSLENDNLWTFLPFPYKLWQFGEISSHDNMESYDAKSKKKKL